MDPHTAIERVGKGDIGEWLGRRCQWVFSSALVPLVGLTF